MLVQSFPWREVEREDWMPEEEVDLRKTLMDGPRKEEEVGLMKAVEGEELRLGEEEHSVLVVVEPLTSCPQDWRKFEHMKQKSE